MGRKLKWVLGGLVLVVLAVVGAGVRRPTSCPKKPLEQKAPRPMWRH